MGFVFVTHYGKTHRNSTVSIQSSASSFQIWISRNNKAAKCHRKFHYYFFIQKSPIFQIKLNKLIEIIEIFYELMVHLMVVIII